MYFFQSLKFKLLFLSFVVQFLLIFFLVYNNITTTKSHLVSQAQNNLAEIKYSLTNTLAGLLISKDYGAIKSIIDEFTSKNKISYIVIKKDDKSLLSSNFNEKEGLPKLSDDFLKAHQIYHTVHDINFYGQNYATVYFGFDISFLDKAKNDILYESIIISIVGLVLSFLSLFGIVLWLTKNLDNLTSAAMQISEGDFNINLETNDCNEVGMLSKSFNNMAQTISKQFGIIKKNNQKFQTIADYTYSWENWFDENGKLKWINPAVERISGYSVNEAMYLTDFPFCIVLNVDKELVYNQHLLALKGNSGQDFEFRIIKKDNFIMWVAMSWQSVYDENNNFVGYRSSIRDISTEHNMSLELRVQEKINQTLEQRVKESVQKLREKDLMLIQQTKMASMGEMIANIAHQWRQPLSAITSSASAVKVSEELGVLDKESLHKYMDMIAKNSHYLSNTIESFRNFFKPNQEKSEFNIKETVDDVINIFGTYFNVNNIKIINNVENITIMSYANGLQQVLLNIVKNAKDAVERDGIIYLQSQILDDGRLELRIKDSGGGIPEDIIGRVFDPYFTTKHKSQGTGIGLNMSYQIVKEHLNGTIDVQNSEFIDNGQTYKGAEFILSITIK
ncbi:MAG: ATP-binding protein [Arcobacteraceae bacterium]|nr:ATP-binding protein [Arcobacteraceae bacterium]